MDRIETIKSYYETNIDSGVHDYEILGWESREAQEKRFDIFVSNTDLQNKKILDVGCGLGNLYEYIAARGTGFSYTGVDILECMVERALSKNPDAEFHCMDVFKDERFKGRKFDIIYASGIFNLNLGNNMEFLMNALAKLSELASESIVFNLLSCYSNDKEHEYYYYDPEVVTEAIDKSGLFSKKSYVIQGYLTNDFTVFINL